MTIRYENINNSHLGEALSLVINGYNEEKEVITYLPEYKEYVNILKKSIENLISKGNGFVALDDNKVVGFITGFRANELFGKSKGIYIPLYGHSVVKENRKRIYQGLYKYAAKEWVKEGYFAHAITLFPDISESVDTWFWMGFGLRCMDSIREVSPIENINPSITVRKAKIEDIEKLAPIHREHNIYYRNSPIFMPREEEDPVEDLTNFLKKENRHLWIAYEDSEPLGYMGIEPVGESYISTHSSIMNITSGYVIESSRQSKVGSTILNSVQNWLLKNNSPLCGVEFESINIIGSSFWTKYFTPYTYSLVRRIDERVNLNVNNEETLEYRILNRDEIEKLKDIDNSEVVHYNYRVKEDKLEEFEFHCNIPRFSRDNLKGKLKHLYDLYDRGGTIYGTFHGDRLVGIVSIDNIFRGRDKNKLQLALIHVDKNFRKRGIGKKLMNLAIERAKELGANKLYISGSPKKNTIDFYLKFGSTLSTEIEEDLYIKEPDDIHLELTI